LPLLNQPSKASLQQVSEHCPRYLYFISLTSLIVTAVEGNGVFSVLPVQGAASTEGEAISFALEESCTISDGIGECVLRETIVAGGTTVDDAITVTQTFATQTVAGKFSGATGSAQSGSGAGSNGGSPAPTQGSNAQTVSSNVFAAIACAMILLSQL